MTENTQPAWADRVSIYYNSFSKVNESGDEAVNESAREFLLDTLKQVAEPSPQDIEKLQKEITKRLEQLDKADLPEDVQTLVWLSHPDIGNFFLNVFGTWDDAYLDKGKFFETSNYDDKRIFEELGGPFYHDKADDMLGGGYFSWDDFEEFEGADLSDYHMDMQGAARDIRDEDFLGALKAALAAFPFTNPKIKFPLRNFTGDVTDGTAMFDYDYNPKS